MSANVIYITSMGCQILRETQYKTSIWEVIHFYIL